MPMMILLFSSLPRTEDFWEYVHGRHIDEGASRNDKKDADPKKDGFLRCSGVPCENTGEEPIGEQGGQWAREGEGLKVRLGCKVTRRCGTSWSVERPWWSRKVPKPIAPGALCRNIARKTMKPKPDSFSRC
jgi:hypothetical protein